MPKPQIKLKDQHVLFSNPQQTRLTKAFGTSRDGEPEQWRLAQDHIASTSDGTVTSTLIPQAFELAERNGRSLGCIHEIPDITQAKINNSPTIDAYTKTRTSHHNVRSWHVVVSNEATADPEQNNTETAKYKVKRFRSVDDAEFVAAAYDADTIAILNQQHTPELVDKLFRVLNASTQLQARPSIPRVRNIELDLNDRSIGSRGYITEKESPKGYLLENESKTKLSDKDAITTNLLPLIKQAIREGSDTVVRIKLNHVPVTAEAHSIMDFRDAIYRIVTARGLGSRFKFVVTLPPNCKTTLIAQASQLSSVGHSYPSNGQKGVNYSVAPVGKPILEMIEESGVITTPFEGKVGIFCCDDQQYEKAIFDKLARKK